MKPKLVIALGLSAIVGALVLVVGLGGLMIWLLGGARSLDIKGTAVALRQAPLSGAWQYYGGDAGGTRYSSAREITRSNVARLIPVGTYSTGDLKDKPQAIRRSAGEVTPIIVDGSLI